MWLWVPLSIVLFYSRDALSTVVPSFTGFSKIGYSESGTVSFPDGSGTGDCPNPFYFIGEMNFLTDGTGNLLIGSADVLFMLNETTLNCTDYFLWETESALSSMCTSSEEICRNYIRLYRRLPSSEASRLLVCGTQSGIAPKCRTIAFTDMGFVSSSVSPAVDAPDKLISNLPDLHQFGEFVNESSTSNDTVYLSGAFFEVDERRNIFGSDYNITYHRVSYTNSSNELNITALFSLKDGTSWLLYPVTLVDYYRADYSPGIEYYLLFVRETLPDVSPEVVNSRVVRICRNDPGADGQFTTFIKTGILCEFDTPRSREFIGASDYQYNDISTMVFNDDGRYTATEGWLKLMYGAFSGPRLGPRGSAICVYRADYGTNSGIVGRFNDDLIRNNPDGSTTFLRNAYPDCDAGGRPSPASGDIRTAHDIEQLVSPLVILDGIIVTQMVLDSVCVVKKAINSECVNQDVLFLGTDTGTILKVVFTTLTAITTEPVISEEISLGDNSRVDDMAIREIDGQKFVFVSTVAKVHRFPVERCSRLQGCQACITARDPYCVWNNRSRLCESALDHLSAVGSGTGTVPQDIWQNVHTGSVEQCNGDVNCTITASAVNYTTIMCSAACNGTDMINITTSLPDVISAVNCSFNDSFSSTSGCRIFQSSENLARRSHHCSAESIFIESVQIPPGPPMPFEDGLHSSCGQTSCTICVHVMDLTDFFDNYAFQVHYSSSNMSGTTLTERLSEGSGCVIIRTLLPGSVLTYMVELWNSVSPLNSTQRTISLLEGLPGPVLNLRSVDVTNVSVTLEWSRPEERNGIVSGYSIYVNNVSVMGCVQEFTDTRYPVNNLVPSTDYIFSVYACTGAGESTMSRQLCTTTLCGTPGPVVNVAVREITFNSMTFEWGRPVNFNGDITYEVMTSIYGVNEVIQSTNSVADNLYRLANILPRTLCCAEIFAMSTCDLAGIPSRICDETMPTAPISVSNLMAPTDTIGIESFSLIWDPPTNLNTVPGVTYAVSINNQSLRNVTDVTFLHVNGLNPCTTYTIEVSAHFSELSGLGAVISVTTLSLLPPPGNVSFFNASEMLGLMWIRSSKFACGDSIQNYRLRWRCNQLVGEADIPSSSTSTVIDISDEDLGIGWCVASIQSCDVNLRCGNFSSEATVSLYQSRPSTPRCLLLMQSTPTNISISFVVSQPFLTNSTLIKWSLSSANSSDSDLYAYTISSTNILDFSVDGNSAYRFNLTICDIYGCSDPCDIEFKTLDILVPPSDINVVNVTNTSALITWSSNSDRMLTSIISLTSSCPNGSYTKDGIYGTNYTIDNLCPYSNYTIAIRATDVEVNESSVYSKAISFFTPTGNPTNPRYILGVFNEDTKQLRVTWVIPSELNGIIEHYEIRLVKTFDCDKANISQKTPNASVFHFIYIEKIASYSVCVRAVTTNRTFGSWGIDLNVQMQTDSLVVLPENCNTLTAVACVAALTVASSLIMSIFLSISVAQKGWFFKNEVHGEKPK